MAHSDDGFHLVGELEEALVGLRVLHDDGRLAVDGQHLGAARLPQACEHRPVVAQEVRERMDVLRADGVDLLCHEAPPGLGSRNHTTM